MIIFGYDSVYPHNCKEVTFGVSHIEMSESSLEVVDMLTKEECKDIDFGILTDYPNGIDVIELDEMIAEDFDNCIGPYIGKTLSEIENGTDLLDCELDYD